MAEKQVQKRVQISGFESGADYVPWITKPTRIQPRGWTFKSFGHDIGLYLPRIKSIFFFFFFFLFDAGPGDDMSIETCQRFCCSRHVLRESWTKAIDLDSFSRWPPHSKRVTWVYIKTPPDPNTSSFLLPSDVSEYIRNYGLYNPTHYLSLGLTQPCRPAVSIHSKRGQLTKLGD